MMGSLDRVRDIHVDSGDVGLLEALGAIGWSADASGRLLSMSERGVAAFGYDDATFRQADFFAKVVPREDVTALASAIACAARGERTTCEHRMRTADGRIVWYRTAIAREGARRAPRGGVRSIVLRGAMLDISADKQVHELFLLSEELRKAQAEHVKRERLAALGELAAVVAHEVRNPLGTIANCIASLRKLVRLEGNAVILFDILREETGRLNRIVADLLDFARPLHVLAEPTTLRVAVEEAIESVRRAKPAARVAATLALPDELPPVMVDPRLLHVALSNVFDNAVQAMGASGTLDVRACDAGAAHVPGASGDAQSADLAEQERDSGFVTLELGDDGPGIPPELAEKVFEPFFTTRASGTGIGLAVVKRIVEAHGGTVELVRDRPRGACFRIRLPRAAENVAHEA
jgi:signal transduction histidine kinase